MASGRTYVRLSTSQLRKRLIKELTEEQTNRLIAYAMEEIVKIGDRIMSYNSAYHMDRTGNLINSLCWGVSYEGTLKQFGFYRKAAYRDNGINGTSQSFIHEWFSGDEKYLEAVEGRNLAVQYIQSYGNNGAKGWKVFFAILAPYWGYWEKGFRMKIRLRGWDEEDTQQKRFMRFAVMTQFYDQIKNDLRPARTRFRVSVRKYQHEKLKERWERRADSSFKFGDKRRRLR